MRRTKAYRLIFVGVASVLLGGCSGSSKANMEEAAEQPAVVDYTCISNPESDKQIYVILKNYHGAYWEKVIDGITEAAKKLDEAVYLGGIDNETDISGQIDLMNQAMEQGADGILLAPADSNSLADSCQKVREKDIPVVLIDSSINSSEFDACYMTDNIDAGEMAAKEMLELLYDAGNSPTDPLEVGIQLSSDSSQAMVNRVSGFLNFWAGNAPEQWEIVQDIRVNGGDTKKAQSDAAVLLRENADIKGFFGCNNTSTVGIVNTLFEEERTDVVLVGFDLADETKQMLQNPEYHAVTVLQKQDQMGYLGMLSLNSLIKGEKSEQKYFDTGVIMVDSDYLMEKKEKKRYIGLSSTDALTGILNRRAFQVELEEQIRKKEPGFFIFIDVDNFKSYNDTYGHNNGDLCLKHFAKAIQECFPEGSILGRYGGDEFVVYLKDVTKESVYIYMEKFQKMIADLTLATGEKVHLSASAGGAAFPEQGEDFISLCRSADAALYNVKQNGKGAFKIK